jgi:O-acetylhomoserine/O-acetylserine sulfhydrylase-like pyridoxal-dependent enzyme
VSPRQSSSSALLVVQFQSPSKYLFFQKKKNNIQDSKYKTKFLWKLSFLVKVLTKPLRDFGVQIALS